MYIDRDYIVFLTDDDIKRMVGGTSLDLDIKIRLVRDRFKV